MTVDEYLEAYESLAGRVFGYPRAIHMRRGFNSIDESNPKRLEEVIKQIAGHGMLIATKMLCSLSIMSICVARKSLPA